MCSAKVHENCEEKKCYTNRVADVDDFAEKVEQEEENCHTQDSRTTQRFVIPRRDKRLENAKQPHQVRVLVDAGSKLEGSAH